MNNFKIPRTIRGREAVITELRSAKNATLTQLSQLKREIQKCELDILTIDERIAALKKTN